MFYDGSNQRALRRPFFSAGKEVNPGMQGCGDRLRGQVPEVMHQGMADAHDRFT